MRSRVSPCVCGVSSRECRVSASFRSIRCSEIEAASQRGGRRGSVTSINIQKSTATRSARYRAGSPRMKSSTFAPTRARCSATRLSRSSRPLPTTGDPRVGWRNWAGCAPSATRADCSSPSAGGHKNSQLSRRGQPLHFVHDAVHLLDRQGERFVGRHVYAGVFQQVNRILRSAGRQKREVTLLGVWVAGLHLFGECRGGGK